MPVIEDLGLSVAVEVDGTALAEYDDPDVTPDAQYPESRIVSKYIEAKDDAEYRIAVKVLPRLKWLTKKNKPNRQISFYAYTDGQWRCACALGQGQQLLGTESYLEGPSTKPEGASHELLHKLRFNAVITVEVTDSKVVEEDRKAAVSLGVIRVEAWRTLYKGSASAQSEKLEQGTLSLAEKALKGRAISHATMLSDPVKRPVESRVAVEELNGRPCAIFLFKYRSRDALRDELIIPRTPSPEPAAEGVDTLSQEKLRRLAAERLADIKQEKKPVIKREFDEMYDLTGEDPDGTARPVKVLRRRKTPETIDLTD